MKRSRKSARSGDGDGVGISPRRSSHVAESKKRKFLDDTTATTSIATNKDAPTPPLSFFDMPLEIRRTTYRWVFHTARIIWTEYVPGPQRTTRAFRFYRSRSFSVSLLSTSKSVRAEAMPVLLHDTGIVMSAAGNPRCSFRVSLPPIELIPAMWRDHIRAAVLQHHVMCHPREVERDFVPSLQAWEALSSLRLVRWKDVVVNSRRFVSKNVTEGMRAKIVEEAVCDDRGSASAASSMRFPEKLSSLMSPLVTVWCLHTDRKSTFGWEAEVNVTTKEIVSLKRAFFTKRKFEKRNYDTEVARPGQVSMNKRDWWRNTEAWMIKRLDESNAA